MCSHFFVRICNAIGKVFGNFQYCITHDGFAEQVAVSYNDSCSARRPHIAHDGEEEFGEFPKNKEIFEKKTKQK